MRVSPILYGSLVVIVFMGTILAFQSAGIWSTSGKVDTSGEKVSADPSDVNTIKGWMTLEEVTIAYNVPLPELLEQFGLPDATDPKTAVKDLESDLFSVTSLRTWLQERQGGAPAATPVVEKTPAVTPTIPASADTSVAAATPTVHAAPERTVTGKTTFQDLLDWGVKPEAIAAVLGTEMPAASLTVKDFCTAAGLDFATIKDALQAEVEKVR